MEKELSMKEEIALQKKQEEEHKVHLQEVKKDLSKGSKDDLLEINNQYVSNINTLGTKRVEVVKELSPQLTTDEFSHLMNETFNLNKKLIDDMTSLSVEDIKDDAYIQRVALITRAYNRLYKDAYDKVKAGKEEVTDKVKGQLSLFDDGAYVSVKVTEKADISVSKDNEEALKEALINSGHKDCIKEAWSFDMKRILDLKNRGRLDASVLALLDNVTKKSVTGLGGK